MIENNNVGDHWLAKIKLSANATTNQLLQSLINNINIISFKEMIPGMNDIFIRLVTQNKEVEV